MTLPWTVTPLPPDVQFARQCAVFWNATLPGRMGAARERLEADNAIATELALQNIRDMARRARLRILMCPHFELADMVFRMENANRVMAQLVLDSEKSSQAWADLGARLRDFDLRR